MKTLFLFLAISFIAVAISTSAGAQWAEDPGSKQSDPNSSVGVLYVDQGVMYYFDFEKYMQKSTDNGASWIDLLDSGLGQKGPGVSRSMVQMQYFNGRLYGALNYSTSGAVYYSTDGGNNWLQDTLGAPHGPQTTDPHPDVIEFRAWGKWLLVHFQGNALYYIREEGQPYSLDSFMNVAGNRPSAFAASGDTLFCLVPGVGIYYTLDGGKTFTTPANTGFIGDAPVQFILEGSRLYAFTSKAFVGTQLLYSDNRGASWNSIDISAAANQHQINGNFVSPIAAFIKGNYIELSFQANHFNEAPNMWKSTNLGQTWSVDTIGLPDLFAGSINYLAYTPDGYLWAVRDHQSLYKERIDAGVQQQSVAAISKEAVSVWPNPSSDFAHVSFEAGAYSSYELLGSLGNTVLAGAIGQGATEINVDFRGLAKGMYWCRLRSQNGAAKIVAVALE